MARYDGSRTPALPRVTAGQVYAALTADPWAMDKLRLAYHKIFEQGSVRPGENENAHFRYVETSRARAEINDLGAWISERFGDPFAGAPKTTPFGYHGAVKYDGWIALFADLACSEGEEDLRKHFDEVVSKMPWNVATSSRVGAASGSSSPAPAYSRPGTAPPEAEAPSLFQRIFAGTARPTSSTSSYVSPTTPSAPASPPAPATEKPGIIERLIGAQPAPTAAYVPPAPPPASQRHRYTETREPMSVVIRRARKLAKSDLPVLLVGETGVGKEVMAQLIHKSSPRADKKMVSFNCAGITDSLAESELFGYKKGAFTGATTDRVGLLEEASGGTVFLDELGEMPPRVQGVLLRAIQEKKVRRVGDTADRPIDVRIIAATNRDLDEDQRTGRFRSDLIQRIEGGEPLVIPPLRERRDEIEGLAQKFLDEAAAKAGRSLSLSSDAMAALRAYDWPGNIRELRSVIERAAVLAEGDVIERENLPEKVAPHGGRYRAPVPTAFAESSDIQRAEAARRAREAAERATMVAESLPSPAATAVAAISGAPVSAVEQLRRPSNPDNPGVL